MNKILTLDEFNSMWDEYRKATLHPLIYTPKPFKITKRRTVKEAVKETRYTESGVPYEVTTLPKQSKEVINTNAVTDLYKAAGKLLFGIEFKRVSAEGKGRLDKKTGKFMWLPSENKGMADLQGLYKGRLICVEIKQPNERLLDSQVKFREWVTNGGGVYIVARSFAEFQDRLHEVIFPMSGNR